MAIIEPPSDRKAERLGNGLGDMNGLSWSCNWPNILGAQDLVVSKKEKCILRDLAKRVAEIAAHPGQEEKKRLWLEHNALGETRPLIFADPENAWYELIPATQLETEGSLARLWEFRLRKEIYWAERIGDDRVIEPAFSVYHIYDESTRGLEAKLIGDGGDGAYRWDAPLTDYSDLDKLRFRRINVNAEKTHRLHDLALEVLGDILPVRLEGVWWWSFGMTSDLILLRGFQQVLYDMFDNPDGLHRLMVFLRDENLAKLDFLEANGLLSLNNGGDYIGTGGYGWSDELPTSGFDGKMTRTRDMWGFGESQETIGVSPDMFEEFVFAYQLPILERFGLNIYGCCEPLDRRFDIIKRIPRLRKVTVSPWLDIEGMAEQLGSDYIYTHKVNPAEIAVSTIDAERIRKGLCDMLRATSKNRCHVEILMRDILTLSGNPENIIHWTQIAREESELV
ncbi:MAG: hypothetical protein J5I90_20915 [Caldilineales bacterium]|nr:hypothetical protein [Caldilineales bacterium]